MFLELTEVPQGMILSYPAWVSLVFALAALAAVFFLVGRAGGNARRQFGGSLAAVFLTLATAYFGSYQARFDDTGASLYAFPRYDLQVDWREVRSARLQRAQNRGQIGHVLLLATASGEKAFNISDLDDAGLRRLMPFLEQQIGDIVP